MLVGWLTLCFSLFGIASLNLFLMLRANLRFIGEHGLVALELGGAAQLVMLIVTAYAAMAFYSAAKWFEHCLMNRIAAAESKAEPATAASSAKKTTTRRSPPPARRPSLARPRRAIVTRGRSAPH